MLLPTTAWTGRGRPRISRDAKHSVAEKSTCCANLRRATRQRGRARKSACLLRASGRGVAEAALAGGREQLTIFARTGRAAQGVHAQRRAAETGYPRPSFWVSGIPMRQLGPVTRSTADVVEARSGTRQPETRVRTGRVAYFHAGIEIRARPADSPLTTENAVTYYCMSWQMDSRC